MRPEEAAYLGRWFSKQEREEISPLIELGASTRDYLDSHPHVERHLHDPLVRRGVRIVKTDIQPGPHIDIGGDIYDPQVGSKLKAVGARCVLCTNILEHVSDREGLARVCDEILLPGGTIVVTVPQSYPLHPDPIDTYYRPKPMQIAELFPGYVVLAAESIVSGTAAGDMADPSLEVLKVMRRGLLLRGGVDATKARLHRLLWLFRPYRVSVAIVRKPADPVRSN